MNDELQNSIKWQQLSQRLVKLFVVLILWKSAERSSVFFLVRIAVWAPVDKRCIAVEDRRLNCISRLFPCKIHCHLRTQRPQVLDQKHFNSATKESTWVWRRNSQNALVYLWYFIFYLAFVSKGQQPMLIIKTCTYWHEVHSPIRSTVFIVLLIISTWSININLFVDILLPVWDFLHREFVSFLVLAYIQSLMQFNIQLH